MSWLSDLFERIFHPSHAAEPPLIPPLPVSEPTEESVTVGGIDIYHGDKVLDWAEIKQNEHFVGIKATQALNFIDPKLKSNAANVKAIGLKRIFYHVLDMSKDPVAQAKFFIASVGVFDQTDGFALDWEQSVNKSVNGGAANCMKFFAAVEAITKKPCLFYSSYAETIAMKFPPQAIRNPLWLARYGVRATLAPAPWKNWTLWQWTESGKVPGIGNCDENYFNGTLDQLKEL